MRFKVNWPITPSKKQPVKFMSNVPYGKVLATRICTRPCRPYRASVQTAPKIAINVRRNSSPIFQVTRECKWMAGLYVKKKLMAGCYQATLDTVKGAGLDIE